MKPKGIYGDQFVWLDVISPTGVGYGDELGYFCLYDVQDLLESLKSGVTVSLVDPETMCTWEYEVS